MYLSFVGTFIGICLTGQTIIIIWWTNEWKECLFILLNMLGEWLNKQINTLDIYIMLVFHQNIFYW